MKLNGAQIGAIVVIVSLVVVAFFPALAAQGARTILGLILVIVVFGVLPLLWRERQR